MAQAANEACDLATRKRKDLLLQGGIALFGRLALRSIAKLASDLGLLRATPEEYFERVKLRRMALRGLTAEAIEAKVSGRAEARKNKDFAAGDALRDELLALGITLMDTPTRTEWSITQ